MNDREWESVKERWLYLWNRWSKPGVGPAWEAAAAIVEFASDIQANAAESDRPALVVLKAICTENQRQADDPIWYLSCRTAADVMASLGFKATPMTTSRWLRQLVEDGVLIRPSKHERGSLYAQRYQTAEAAAR